MVLSLEAWGQVEFAPVGAKWGMSFYSFSSPNLSYAEMIVEKDTLFEGKVAKKLLVEIDQGGFTSSHSNYIHQSEDSIFVFSFNTNEYQYMYNFELEVGDSINFLGFTEMMTYHIDSISIETVNNIPLKMQHVSVICPENNIRQEMLIMEKIGPFSHANIFLLEHLCVLDGISYNFRCYSEPNFLEYVAPYLAESGTDCFFVTSLDNTSAEKLKIDVYPNPITSHMQLNFPNDLLQENLNIELITTSGQNIEYKTKKKSIKNMEWELSHLPKGIYFIKITTTEGYSEYKKILKL